MKILAVDDERIALEVLVNAIKEAKSDAIIYPFRDVNDAFDFIDREKEIIDVAFLDINMQEINGIDAAEILKQKLPQINIIFATGYDEYMTEAFKMHSSGYVTKPITKEKILKELNDLRYPVLNKKQKLLKAICFGNFDCFTMESKQIHFERQKCKELLAYLIYRKGATSTIKEIASVLFEDDEYDIKLQAYIQKIISSLIKTLKEVGAQAVIIKGYNELGINKELVDVDYYKVLDGIDSGLYTGEFMAQYSWAEDVNYFLMNK